MTFHNISGATDVTSFTSNIPKTSCCRATLVLLFPPVNNYRRFLIHQSCENYRDNFDLFTFSVGQGLHRRTVICFKSQLLDPIKFTSSLSFETKKPARIKNWRSGSDKIDYSTTPSFWSLPSSSASFTKTTKREVISPTATNSSITNMGVEKHRDSSSSASSRCKLNKSHSVDIYRPPALRRNFESIDNENHYLPQQQQKQGEQSPPLPLQPNEKKCISTNSLSITTPKTAQNGCNGIESETTNFASNTASSNQRQVRRERRPDRAVYVPRARRSQTTPPAVTTQQQHQEGVPDNATNNLTSSTTTPLFSTGTTSSTTNASACICKSPTGEKSTVSSGRRSNKDRGSSGRKEKSSSSSKRISSIDDIDQNNSQKNRNSNNNNFHNSEEECSSSVRVREKRKQLRTDKPSTKLLANGSVNSNLLSNGYDKNVKSCDISNNSTEFSDSTNAMNNCKTSVCNTSGASDVKKVPRKMNNKSVPVQLPLVLPESVANLRIEDALISRGERSDKCDRDTEELFRASKEINRSNRRIMKQTFNSDVLEIPDKTVLKSSAVGKNISAMTSGSDDNEDDWDSMYDDSGDCLDPKIIQELSASVGKVKIELPKMDYSAYLTKQSILNDEEFPHVLEVSNFPVEFKNQDLLMVFSQYKESGFEIKWVDDTHALAVFSSSQVAAEVLAMGHPFVVLKPLAEATAESRLKAKKCSASLQPYRPRPETCAALARRLVTGALGVRLKTAPQERENEKRVLREAKERKLLAAKQRDEAWES